jgi:hypothetical protein
MARGTDVLTMLIPEGGWAIAGDDFEGITFIEANPISKAKFEAGFAQYDAWKIEQDSTAEANKAAAEAKLAALGLTTDELKALLS